MCPFQSKGSLLDPTLQLGFERTVIILAQASLQAKIIGSGASVGRIRAELRAGGAGSRDRMARLTSGNRGHVNSKCGMSYQAIPQVHIPSPSPEIVALCASVMGHPAQTLRMTFPAKGLKDLSIFWCIFTWIVVSPAKIAGRRSASFPREERFMKETTVFWRMCHGVWREVDSPACKIRPSTISMSNFLNSDINCAILDPLVEARIKSQLAGRVKKQLLSRVKRLPNVTFFVLVLVVSSSVGGSCSSRSTI